MNSLVEVSDIVLLILLSLILDIKKMNISA